VGINVRSAPPGAGGGRAAHMAPTFLSVNDMNDLQKLEKMYARKTKLLHKLNNHRAKVVRRTMELAAIDIEIRAVEARTKGVSQC